jgi:hypothetical protein
MPTEAFAAMQDSPEQVEALDGIIPLEPEVEVKPVRPPVVNPDLPPPSAASKIRMLEECARVEHEAYHLPAVLLAGGLLAALILTPLGSIIGEMANGRPWATLGAFSLSFAAGLGVGLVIFEICSALGVVTEAPWKLTSLRLAASFAVADALAAGLFLLIPFDFIPQGFALLAFFVMMRTLVDLDTQDAGIVALSLYLPRFFIGVWIAWQFGLLG